MLSYTDNSSFVIFSYSDIQWTIADNRTANESARHAVVGFSAGADSTPFLLPGSGSEDVITLNTSSNIGLAGLLLFQVDGENIISAGK